MFVKENPDRKKSVREMQEVLKYIKYEVSKVQGREFLNLIVLALVLVD